MPALKAFSPEPLDCDRSSIRPGFAQDDAVVVEGTGTAMEDHEAFEKVEEEDTYESGKAHARRRVLPFCIVSLPASSILARLSMEPLVPRATVAFARQPLKRQQPR